MTALGTARRPIYPRGVPSGVTGPAFRVVGLAAALAIWQLIGLVANTPWVPPFTTVIVRVADLVGSGAVGPAILASITSLAGGFLLAMVIGVGIGAMMALSPVAEDMLQPYIELGLATPHIVLAPVFFAFFGLSDWTMVAVVFIFAIFVIVVQTQTAIKSVDRRLQEMAVSFGASRLTLFREVTLRAAGPMIFSGLRVGVGRGVKGLIVGEIFVTVVGLGALERQFSGSFDGAGMWAVAAIIIAMAIVLTSIVKLLDRLVNAWAN